LYKIVKGGIAMNEQEWMQRWVAKNPDGDWIEFLLEKGASARKFRLFSCACCRLIWLFLTYEHTREVVEVAEGFADGLVTEAGRDAAEVGLYPVHNIRDEKEQSKPEWQAAIAASYAVWSDPRGNHGDAHGAGYIESHVRSTIAAAQRQGATSSVEEQVDAAGRYFLCLWGDIFGIFFDVSPVIDPSWLNWNNGTVRKLAASVYENRELPSGRFDPDRVGVLADALEEAGCTNPDILGHVHWPGSHVRGCWVVDLVLGKE